MLSNAVIIFVHIIIDLLIRREMIQMKGSIYQYPNPTLHTPSLQYLGFLDARGKLLCFVNQCVLKIGRDYRK